MFDRALAPRPPTAWQADPALFEGASASGFAAWRIAPLQGELSDLSREALARFEADLQADAPEDTSSAPATSAEAQALPFKPGLASIVTAFVPDVHVPIGQTRREPAADVPAAPAEPREQAFAREGEDTEHPAAEFEHAAERGVSDSEAPLPQATDTDANPDDGSAPESAALGAATELAQEAPSNDEAVATDERAELAVEADCPAPSLPEDPAASVTEADLADDDVIAPDALAEVEQERAESLAAQAQPVGIDPEEVARREAEHYQLGREEGERAAREAMEQEVNAQRTVLASVAQDLHALLQNPTEFFEPLKRLALHLAEQITLTQWQSSTQTLEALIQRCLDTLDHATQGAVVVELHPLDKARLQQAAPELIHGMRLDANDALRVGSVRLYANDTVVEDLIEHRLQAIVRSLHIDAQAWEPRSLLLREPNADTETPSAPEDDDVHS